MQVVVQVVAAICCMFRDLALCGLSHEKYWGLLFPALLVVLLSTYIKCLERFVLTTQNNRMANIHGIGAIKFVITYTLWLAGIYEVHVGIIFDTCILFLVQRNRF